MTANGEHGKETSYLEYADRQASGGGFIQEVEPARDDEEPGDVRRRSRQRADNFSTHSRPGRARAGHHTYGLRVTDYAVAVVHGALRQLRRGNGRGPWKGTSRQPAKSKDGDNGESFIAKRSA